MYLAGRFFAFPLAISSYFGSMSVIYTIIDIQSLISAALIFTTFFYYPLRMIISPRYARAFWRNLCHSWRAGEQRVFTLYWFVALAAILLVLCTPYDSVFIAGYLVPLIFILYFIGISRLGHTLIRISWSVSAFLLVAYNQNFYTAYKLNIHCRLFFRYSFVSLSACFIWRISMLAVKE